MRGRLEGRKMVSGRQDRRFLLWVAWMKVREVKVRENEWISAILWK